MYCLREICCFHPKEQKKRDLQISTQPKGEVLPPGWIKRESRSVPGKKTYLFNI